MDNYLALAPILGVVGLLASFLALLAVRRNPPGNKQMQGVSGLIRVGALAFLYREYRILAIFVVAVAGTDRMETRCADGRQLRRGSGLFHPGRPMRDAGGHARELPNQ